MRYIAAGLAGLILVGFMVAYGIALGITFMWKHGEPMPVFNNAHIYIATGLAGIVVGVATTAFHSGGGQRLLQPRGDVLVIATAVYVIGYFLIGIAAIVAWGITDDHCPDLVKNLALITIGLAGSTVRFFFNIPNPPAPPAAPARP